MKVFKDKQWFDFSPITLLTGTNNSGKSSVIYAMQLIQDNLTNSHKCRIDDYFKMEFRLNANQNKYGNIESFVNRDSEKKEFVFELRNNNLIYAFTIDVNEGLESYGTVKKMIINDPKTNEKIFSIETIRRSPGLSCRYAINYKYFVGRLMQKCQNTIDLNKHKEELDVLCKLVDSREAPPGRLYAFVDELSYRYSVNIFAMLITGEDSEDNYYDYFIVDRSLDGVNRFNSFGEIGVFFVKKDSKNGPESNQFMSESEFKEQFLRFYEYGAFDFDQILEKESIVRLEFEALIAKHYNSPIKESYASLSNDLLTILSNTYWDVEERYATKNKSLLPADLIEKYLKCHPDFGLVASAIVLNKDYDESGNKDFKWNFVANNRLNAKCHVDYRNDEVQALIRNGFFENVYERLIEIIYNYYDHRSEGVKFEKRNKILFNNASEHIFKDIDKKIINIDLGFQNLYVSSNRFQVKRSYNFSDNTDFTSLLKSIETLSGKEKVACLEFINKWIKEFDIADEMILKPDVDTGNFKAYLRNNDHEVILADFGLGTNQLLPIIFSLAINSYEVNQHTRREELSKRTVVIEEPESNLHPAMQSKLADLFVDSYKTFGVQIIVETHSEYLIRKLQFLVGSNTSELKPKDVVIFYFYKPDHDAVVNNRVNQVEKIEIDEFGKLTKEFGSGFFDEADRISLELFLLNEGQFN